MDQGRRRHFRHADARRTAFTTSASSRFQQSFSTKPGKYTDEEFAQVRLHTQYGYELLKPLPLDAHIKLAALSHHERCDGTGYPNGLTTNDIDPYARVVAIADVYDAMTTARSYRAPLCAFQVIANFETVCRNTIPNVFSHSSNRIAGTYQNHRILLSDGRSANIVMLQRQEASGPIAVDDLFPRLIVINCGRSAGLLVQTVNVVSSIRQCLR